jgi:rhamnogalacturonan endolyase
MQIRVTFKYLFISILSGFVMISSIIAQQQMEYLNRGVYAINQGNGKVFVSWRLLGTESNDKAFNIYKTIDGKTIKLNKEPLVTASCFIDEYADTTIVSKQLMHYLHYSLMQSLI